MRQIEVRVWIDRPVDEVYAYVVDFARWPEWRNDVDGGELLTEGPVRVGTQARGIARIFGRPFTIDVEVTALEPGMRFGYRPIRGALKTNNLYTFESREGRHPRHPHRRHRSEWSVQSLPARHARVRPVGYRKDLAGLKAVLEARPPAAA